MQKKKNNNDLFIVGVITLVLVLFLSFNLGLAIYDVEQSELKQDKEYELTEKIELITGGFEHHLQMLDIKSLHDAKNIRDNDTVKKTVFTLCFVWFLAVAYYTSEKKNFITNKEYGTARWGNQNDIRGLFASTIKAKEISEAKKMGNYIGFFFAWRKKKKNCAKYAEKEKKLAIKKIEREYEEMIKDLENQTL